MVEQLLLLFQALFLVLLYAFIWRVMRTASRDLRAPQESFVLAPGAGIPPASAASEAAPVSRPPARMIVVQSPALAEGQAFELDGLLTLGRAADNTVVLASDQFASTHHARIEAPGNEAWIVDLGSRNGTFLNGQRIVQRSALRPHDVVRIGATDLRVGA